MLDRLKRIFLGRRKDFRDPSIHHQMALIPFLAWVGLGADGQSSSAYGPEEAFRALGPHTYLAVGLALATGLTVFIISAAYGQIIEHFPAGGGGYVVATKLLGSRFGVISGCALLVDYVLTITVSVASGADAVFSFLPPSWVSGKFEIEIIVILLLGAHPVEGQTMNAVLADRVSHSWHLGPIPLGRMFYVTTLVAEGALLFVAAQAGFIDGPRVMANMASDSWLPHRFSALSDRLTTQNGVLLMGGAALLALLYTHGNVAALVVMYSINVFLTFSLSQAGMVRFWIGGRKEHEDWKRHLPINLVGFLLCVSILAVTVAEKFTEGGWITLFITGVTVVVCLFIRRHYGTVRLGLSHLDKLFADIPIDPKKEELGPTDPSKATAAIFVGGYGGLGVHTVLTLLRMFPGQFTNMMFISVGVIDSGNFKGATEV
jgi:amino acid transporter